MMAGRFRRPLVFMSSTSRLEEPAGHPAPRRTPTPPVPHVNHLSQFAASPRPPCGARAGRAMAMRATGLAPNATSLCQRTSNTHHLPVSNVVWGVSTPRTRIGLGTPQPPTLKTPPFPGPGRPSPRRTFRACPFATLAVSSTKEGGRVHRSPSLSLSLRLSISIDITYLYITYISIDISLAHLCPLALFRRCACAATWFIGKTIRGCRTATAGRGSWPA